MKEKQSHYLHLAMQVKIYGIDWTLEGPKASMLDKYARKS
jgi:hypothetical protein